MPPPTIGSRMTYIVMAYIVMAYAVMAYIFMAYIIMADIVMAYIVMASNHWVQDGVCLDMFGDIGVGHNYIGP